MRAVLRVATAPLTRVRVAVWAVFSAVMAAVIWASVGVGLGNAGLPVIPFTMFSAYVMKAGT